MVGNTVWVLPFGLWPVFLFAGFVLFVVVRNRYVKGIGSKHRGGITEYPSEVSMVLYGTDANNIAFSDDGKNVVLTIESPGYMSLNSSAEVKEFLTETIRLLDGVDRNWVNHYIVTSIIENKENGTHQIVISIPDEVVLTDQYIDHEIQNLGRVFTSRTPHEVRTLLWPQGQRKTLREDGRLFVYIDRLQAVPGFFSIETVVMSEKQITRNIKNRLWNRVEVKCISIDEKTYCGEILGV